MNFLLNRGGAGKSLNRSQSAAEMSNLMKSHIGLLRTYEALVALMGDDTDSISTLKSLQKQHRTEIAQLSEIVLSSAGIPPRDADRLSGDDVSELTRAIDRGERSLRGDLQLQLKQKHHRRTIAVLESHLENTEARIGEITTLTKRLNVPI
jgi:hypothetical protein